MAGPGKVHVVRAYACYSFMKFVALVSVILAHGVSQKALLETAFTKTLCDTCYARSLVTSTDTLIEFGACASNFNTGSTNITYQRNDHLLWPQDGFFDFKPISSVSTFVWAPALLWVIVFLFGACGLITFCVDSAEEYGGSLLTISFWMSVVCLSGVQLVFSLYPTTTDGCFLASGGTGMRTASTVFLTISMLFIYGSSSKINSKAKICLVAVQFVFFLIYACLVVAMGASYSQGSGDASGVVVSVLCMLSLVEGPLIILGIAALWATVLAVARVFGIIAQVEANLAAPNTAHPPAAGSEQQPSGDQPTASAGADHVPLADDDANTTAPKDEDQHKPGIEQV